MCAPRSSAAGGAWCFFRWTLRGPRSPSGQEDASASTEARSTEPRQRRPRAGCSVWCWSVWCWSAEVWSSSGHQSCAVFHHAAFLTGTPALEFRSPLLRFRRRHFGVHVPRVNRPTEQRDRLCANGLFSTEWPGGSFRFPQALTLAPNSASPPRRIVALPLGAVCVVRANGSQLTLTRPLPLPPSQSPTPERERSRSVIRFPLPLQA